MKITEVTVRRYFHGSRKRFPVGFVLQPQSDGYVQAGTGDPGTDSDVMRAEEVLERYRPRRAISRRSAVFMVDRPDPDLIEYAGGYADFIYAVEPIGNVWKTNLPWYSQILLFVSGMSPYADIDDFRDLKRWATNYWKAARSSRNNYEYLCSSAKITGVISR